MTRRLRWAIAAFVDTWHGQGAHHELHVANARNTILRNTCHRLRDDIEDALARAEHAEGENQRLTEDNERLERWLQLDALETIWNQS